MKYIIFYISCIALVFSSCSDDFLDRQPLDSQVSSTFYKTEEDAQKALIAIYDVLGYQSSPGISWSPFLITADMLSDDAFGGGSDANDGQDEDELNKFNIPTTNQIVHSIWLRNYVGVYRANLLLEKMDEIDASEEFKLRVTAECKFLRAYFYTELVRFFENIPLLTNTIKGPSEYSQPQSTPDAVYNQIAKDLVEAMNDLPTTTTANERGRITKWAAQALLARVYLFYDGVYGGDLVAGETIVNAGTVVTYLDELIAGSGHDLIPVYDSLFRESFEFSVESVLEVAHGDSPAWWDWGYLRGAEGNLSAQMQGPRVTGSEKWNRGWSFAPVSQSLASALKDDPRFDATILMEEELDGSLIKGYQHTGYFSQKYTSDAQHWGSDGQFEHNRTCNYRVIRFADVLLMAAELGSSSAQQYLDRVRARVGLPSIPATKENIIEERRKELALEGVRYFDVLRQGMGYAEDHLTQSGIRGPNYEGDQLIFDIQFKPATRGFLPIPQVEVDLSNGTFKQNAGY